MSRFSNDETVLINNWGLACLFSPFPFSNLFFMKTVKDFSDGHLWFSVISRPANSSFTSVQRVSCCFSLLLCTMLTSIMFYGIPTDPSEQTMDLGSTDFFLLYFVSCSKKISQCDCNYRSPLFCFFACMRFLFLFSV